jgi:hypothetical protein
MDVIGRFKTSHSWALQNQPPLTGCFGGQFNKAEWLPGSLGSCFLLPLMADQIAKPRLPLVEILAGSITTSQGSHLPFLWVLPAEGRIGWF